VAQGGHLRHRSNRDSYLWYSGPAAERCWRTVPDEVDGASQGIKVP